MTQMDELSRLLREIENELRDAAEEMPGELSVVNKLYYRTLEAAQQAREIRLSLP